MTDFNRWQHHSSAGNDSYTARIAACHARLSIRHVPPKIKRIFD